MERYRGRGALSNPPPRYLEGRTEGVDDGWYREELPESIATQVRPEPARSIITRNDSPDIPFEQSINPYRGCEHGCPYCLAGDTPILMADGSLRPLAQIRAGDAIYGTERRGCERRYVRTRVLAHWSVIKPAYRICLEDGTEIVAGADHRFLTERGWTFVAGAAPGQPARPALSLANKLMGTGAFTQRVMQDEDYRRGYLCGLIRGDGQAGEYSCLRLEGGGSSGRQTHLLRAPCDAAALERAAQYLCEAEVETRRLPLSAGAERYRPMQTVRTHALARVERVRELIAWPGSPQSASRNWHAGFLAGVFDAEGSYSHETLRISHTDPEIVAWTGEALRALAFRYSIEHGDIKHGERTLTKPIDVVRVLGGLPEQLRFFHRVDPAIARKRDIAGQAVKSGEQLRVTAVQPLGRALRLYDITTGTEDFIANGVVSHNCYARPSHAYLDLSPGIDFETKIFYKAEAARRLEEELARPGYVPKQITLGANTDPYQPLERQLRVTRSVLEVLERTRHPLSIVTKGALILRDLDLLTSLAKDQLVTVFVSVTTLDVELKRTLEPRAASPAARLRIVRELCAAGVPTGVLIAPIIPAVNDSELERIIAAVAAAGAASAGYVLLRLPHELKQIFRQWLEQHMPDRAEHVMALMRDARDGRENDPRFGSRMVGTGAWADLLRDRFALACKRHGIHQRRLPSPSPVHFRPPGRGGQMTLPL
ncbi:MAG TPA: PA0069 family radical SAM protein [Steroidobacteraceae bacterium]|nr:PA0069 family radical SAM protein [Steroidobacteraceae bacterium]